MRKIPLAGTAPALLAIACGVVVTAAEAQPVANLPLACSSADAIGQPQDNCNGDWAYQLPNTDQLIVLKGPSSAPVWIRASSLTNSDTVNVCTLPVEPGTYSNCRDAAGVRRFDFVPNSQVFLDSSPPSGGSTGARVLDLSAPVVISAPGLYVIDRDWSVGGLRGPYVGITADNVTLDMQGFEVAGDGPDSLVGIAGNFVTVRNGRLNSSDGFALSSRGSTMLVEGMRITGFVDLSGGGSVLVNSFILGQVSVERGATARNNRVTSRVGSEYAVWAQEGAYVLDNHFNCAGLTCVTTYGQSVIRNNVITSTGTAIHLFHRGQNQVLDNVVLVRTHADTPGTGGFGEPIWIYRSGEVAIEVADIGGNLIRGNYVQPSATYEPEPGPGGIEVHPWRVGIRFLPSSQGNRYGDNLMYADVPYDLGSTRQVDLGGNQPLP